MTFNGEDPIAIHSVASAAQRIVRDLCERRGGDIESYVRFKDRIAPGHEDEFWQAVNRSANFFKHADRDAESIYEMKETETDFVIVLASKWYVDLGYSESTEMRIFAWWFALGHPNTITESAKIEIQGTGLLQPLEQMLKAARNLDRADVLKAGRMALEKAKTTPLPG